MFIQQPFNLTGAAAGDEAGWVPKGAVWLDGGGPDYLTRTPGSAGNRRTYTHSCWIKLEKIDYNQMIWAAGTSQVDYLVVDNGANIQIVGVDGGASAIDTTAVYRDPTAWMHIVWVTDTTDPVGADRVRLFINGVRVTNFATYNAPTLNAESNTNNTVAQNIGVDSYDNSNMPCYMYLSEVILLDGYAAPPSDFGTEDSNGVWIPKDPTDTVTDNKGTNGYWLDFADSSDLGNDVSGNSNNYTTNSMSSANWTYDRPADEAPLTGNYATFNPLDVEVYSGGIGTLSNGNLTHYYAGTSDSRAAAATISTSSGKWYWEITYTTVASGYPMAGILKSGTTATTSSANEAVINGSSNGNFANFGVNMSTAWGAYSNGNVVMFALDQDNGALYVGRNGTWETTSSVVGIPDSGVSKTGVVSTNAALSDGTLLYPFVIDSSGSKTTANFGQSTFAYPIGASNDTEGYSALNTANMPSVTVTKPTDNFLPILYEGNGKGQRVGNFIPFTDSHTVNYSAVFNSGDSDSLSRTMSSTSGNTEFMFSAWIKRGLLGGASCTVASSGASGSDMFVIRFVSDNTLLVGEYSGGWEFKLQTNRCFEFTDTWFNLVVRYKSDESTSSDRIKIEINGVQETSFSTETYPSSSYACNWNKNVNHNIGLQQSGSGAGDHFDGYLAEVVNVSGTSTDIVGQTDTSTNRWIPKDVSGLTFGSNGFYLDMADGNALGDDESGNTNDFTMNNMDANNQTYDTPTRNFATFDYAYYTANMTYSNGNRTIIDSTATPENAGTTVTFPTTGKWYMEMVLDARSTTSVQPAFGLNDNPRTTFTSANNVWLVTDDGTGNEYDLYVNDVLVTQDYMTIAEGSIVQICYDADTGKVWFGDDNTYVGDPAAGTGEAGSLIVGTPYYFAARLANSAQLTLNTGSIIGTIDTGYGANVCSPGMTVTANAGGTTLSNLVDGNLTTNAYNADGSSGWLQIDLGSGNAKTVTKIWIDFKQDNDNVSTFRIQASNSSDMSSAFDFYPTTSVSWSNGENVTFTKANTTAYRYWRFEKVSGGGSNNLNMFEVEMYESATSSTALKLDAGGYFVQTPPTDFIALQQDNYSENTTGITGLAWIKNRDAADFHVLSDRVSGVYKYIPLYVNAAEDLETNTNSVQRFLQQGVQVGNMNEVNTSAESFVLWQWVANGAGTTNTDGSGADSTVSVNTTAEFSILTYTGDGVSGRTIGTGLTAQPAFMIVNNITDDGTYKPQVYHQSIGNTGSLTLTETSAVSTDTSYWNDTSPATSTPFVFSVGNSNATNRNLKVFKAYVWAEVEGYSKFGSYTGNGDNDGPYVTLGFKPSYVFIKRTDAVKNWMIIDAVRDSYNPVNLALLANSNVAESSADLSLDFTSNGFKFRLGGSSYGATNESGGTYVYAAFAENPFGGSGVAQAKAR